MIDPQAPSVERYVLVEQTDGVFAADIADRLRCDGGIVVERLADLPPGAVLEALVVDVVVATDVFPFRAVADDDFHALLDRQLYRFVARVQAAAPHMTVGGAIVLVVPNAYLGAWGGVHVAASAAACIAMARSMALELAPRGIRVNSVATARPGEAWDTPAARAEIAATVAWLAGEGSGQVTGDTILADRGASLRMGQATRR